ncbi:MAG: hypothetical protein N3J91_02590 [Verrucomicrobiae bacterium]|nr:hypothetical protein [Verrucomicrobiae bacterium]
MPIRINLLAEAQAEEELRRKDPVKRIILGAVGLVLVVVVWTGTLVMQAMAKQSELATTRQKLEQLKPRHEQIKRNDLVAVDARQKIERLHYYATNRFLWAPVLNALAQVCTNNFATNITFNRLQTEQIFVELPAVKAVTNAAGQILTPARPEGIVERNRMVVDARDYGQEVDNNYNKFQTAMTESPFFKSLLDPRNPATLNQLTLGAADPLQPGSRPFRTFVMQFQFAEKFREKSR